MAFMAQPWKDPRSGIYYIRRRVPKDAKPHLPHFGEFYKRSLETTCPQDAKVRFAAEWVKSQELFDLARRQASGTYQPTARDAVQLAARWAKRELEDLDQTGDFTRWLVDIGDGPKPLGILYGQGAARDLVASEDAGKAWTSNVAPPHPRRIEPKRSSPPSGGQRLLPPPPRRLRGPDAGAVRHRL